MKSNTIIIAVAIVIIAAGAYWYLSTRTGNEPPLTAGITENQTQIQFQTLVSKLQPISFETGILSDPRFNALVDLSTPVTYEAPGRLDPFAPITGISEK